MVKKLFEGRLLGHPVHPMLVHFPTALFTISFVFDVLGLYMNDLRFSFASFYCIAAGLLFGIAAGIFGLIDYLKLADIDDQVFKKASWHGCIQFCIVSGFAVLLGIRFQAYPEFNLPGFIELTISGALITSMFIGNYLGGDLVIRHGVGVDKGKSETWEKDKAVNR